MNTYIIYFKDGTEVTVKSDACPTMALDFSCHTMILSIGSDFCCEQSLVKCWVKSK